MMKYPNLFEPISLGTVQLKNRIIMSPMHVNLSEDSYGQYTKRYIDYFAERAKGGVGLIITGHVKAERTIDPYGYVTKFPCLADESDIKYFRELTDTVHCYGSKIAVELSAGSGRNADCILPDKHPIGASEVPMFFMPDKITRALTKEEIKDLVKAYGVACKHAKMAGFDIIYVHAYTHLIDQFLTPAWNGRTDEYGGCIENRMRFMIECIEEARKQIGDDFPMMAGISMDQGIKNGLIKDDVITIAKKLEELNMIALHLRMGSYDGIYLQFPTYVDPTAGGVDYAAEIRQHVNIPVSVDGALLNPETCEQIISKGKVDLVGLGRPLISDPYWAKKARLGQREDIRPCLRCLECLNKSIPSGYCECSVNPEVGREGFKNKPSFDPKHILVIGGGQSGMLSAIYAAERGHNVTLVEKNNQLGGHMLEGSMPEFKIETNQYLKWIQRQLNKHHVNILLNTKADKEFVKNINPDSIIVTTGSTTSIPPVKGYNKTIVKTATSVLVDDSTIKDEVIIIGSGLVGCETAMYLHNKGKKVTLVDRLPQIGQEISLIMRFAILGEIHHSKIQCIPNAQLSEVTDTGIIYEDAKGDEHVLHADHVLFATGLKADNQLYNELLKEHADVYAVGDCVRARKFIDANREAYAVSGIL